MIVIKKVLVATDFSEASKTALRYGRDLARSYQAELHVLHVTDDLLARYPIEMYPVLTPGLQAEVNQAAREQVEGLVSAEDRQQLRARAAVRTAYATATGIVDYATDERIDVIVIGTHGRGGMSHLLLGSVAERVVRMAPCPVLTVREQEREFLAPDALAKV